MPWRRFAVDRNDKSGDVSEEEIHCEWSKPKENSVDSDSDGDMLIVDKRKEEKKNFPDTKVADDSDEDMVTVNKKVDLPVEIVESEDEPKEISMEVDSDSSIDYSLVESEAFKGKIFYLNNDLASTSVIKFNHIIKYMLGSVTKDPSKANYIITRVGKELPKNTNAEVVKEMWIQECHDLKAFIPTTRYRL